MSERVQVILRPEEKLRLQRRAERDGSSLSAWIRQVALERLEKDAENPRFGSPEDLRAFFARCAELEPGGEEPDWEVQRNVIDQSRGSGESPT